MNRNNNMNGQASDKSFRYNRAETMALSLLLQSIKAENNAKRSVGRNSKNYALPADEVVSLSCLEAMMVEEMKDIFSTREQVAKQRKVENAILVDHFGDHGVYTGYLRKGEPHRYGTMTYDDGRIYEGNWINGRYHGKGHACFPNGDFYTGEYKSDHMHGHGTYCWNDGRAYAGEFCEDERQGHGVYSWPDGSTFTGSFVGGQMHGSGIYESGSGTRYEGEFSRGQWHGCGCLTYDDGRRYEGEFRLGRKDGDGEELCPDGTIVHKGLWHNGERVEGA
jgi:hypothetical protein